MEQSESQPTIYTNKSLPFFHKLFFYEGLVVFLPFLVINLVSTNPSPLPFSEIPYFIFLVALGLLIIILMDIFSIESIFFDRNRKPLTLIGSGFGLLSTIFLIIVSWQGWDNRNDMIMMGSSAILICYEFLGWFFVRADRGITSEIKKPSFTQSMYALFICSAIFFLEIFFFEAVLIGLATSFLLYLILGFKNRTKDVIPNTEVRKIVYKYDRMTVWNFSIDLGKAFALVFAIVIFSYNSDIVLYPNPLIYGVDAWRYHLALTCLFAALAMLLYKYMQKKFQLSVIILVLILNVLGGLMMLNTENVFHFRWILGIINGFSLAGIFYFIEQKMNDSSNVRALPGSFYFAILIIMAVSLALRSIPTVNLYIDQVQTITALIGLGYIIGCLKESTRPKSLRASFLTTDS